MTGQTSGRIATGQRFQGSIYNIYSAIWRGASELAQNAVKIYNIYSNHV